MDIQEFVKLHPKVIQYEQAGVVGIDLDLLHKKIECSKYLQSRQSFVFLLKNYQRICAGYYDDFNPKEKPAEPSAKEKALIKLRQKLETIKTLKPTLSKKFNQLCKSEYGVTIEEFIERLQFAYDQKRYNALYDERGDLQLYDKISMLICKHGNM